MKDLNFSPITVTKPADIIMMQLRDLITKGILKPGDKLPSERLLAEQFAIGRGHIREALKKMEFYGILRTLPQSGTSVANFSAHLLNGLIANIIQFEKNDFETLLETRSIIEPSAARLAAQRATPMNIAQLEKLFERYQEKALKGEPAMDEDMLFHIKIAEISGNRVLQSMISLIVPEVHQLSLQKVTCRPKRLEVALKEHAAILGAIQEKDCDKAFETMLMHMNQTTKPGL